MVHKWWHVGVWNETSLKMIIFFKKKLNQLQAGKAVSRSHTEWNKTEKRMRIGKLLQR